MKNDSLNKTELLEIYNSFSIKNIFTDKRILVLLFSNIFTIVIAIIEHWNIFTVMWIYWFQSVLIGFFNFLQILTLDKFSTEDFKINETPVSPTKSTKIKTAFFFLFHYGFFHFVYAIFLSSMGLFFPGNYSVNFYSTFLINAVFILISVGLFLISQIQNFIENVRTFDSNINIGTLMFFPYARIIPMHLTIILSGFLGIFNEIGFSGGVNVVLLIVFTSLKTIADVIMQYVEIKKFTRKKIIRSSI